MKSVSYTHLDVYKRQHTHTHTHTHTDIKDILCIQDDRFQHGTITEVGWQWFLFFTFR